VAFTTVVKTVASTSSARGNNARKEIIFVVGTKSLCFVWKPNLETYTIIIRFNCPHQLYEMRSVLTVTYSDRLSGDELTSDMVIYIAKTNILLSQHLQTNEKPDLSTRRR
jgi:hypothetical protein